MTVQELAERHGVSARFMTQALAQVEFHVAGPDSQLPASVIARFEQQWSAKIAARRPEPAESAPVESDPVQAPPFTQLFRAAHVMRPAYSKSVWTTTATGAVVRQLPPEPGLMHAIDLIGTRDGDPFSGAVEPGITHFYEGVAASGPPAACGTPHMRAVLSGEFIPADDPAAENQCVRCARAVADGTGFRNEPGTYISSWCEDYLRVRVNSSVRVKSCRLRDHQTGPHRADDGSEWQTGVDDYVPAPDEVGSRITPAS